MNHVVAVSPLNRHPIWLLPLPEMASAKADIVVCHGKQGPDQERNNKMPLPNTRFWNGFDREPFHEVVCGAMHATLENELSQAWMFSVEGDSQVWRLNPFFDEKIFRDALERHVQLWPLLPGNREKLTGMLEQRRRLGRQGVRVENHDDLCTHVLELLAAFFDPAIDGWSRFALKAGYFKVKLNKKNGPWSVEQLAKPILLNLRQVMLEVMQTLDAFDATQAILATPRLDHLGGFRHISQNRVLALQSFERAHRQLVNWIMNPELSACKVVKKTREEIDPQRVSAMLNRVLGEGTEIEDVRAGIKAAEAHGRFYRCQGAWFKRFDEEKAGRDGWVLASGTRRTAFIGKKPLLYVGAVPDYYDQIDPSGFYSVCWAAIKQVERGEAWRSLSRIRVEEDSEALPFDGEGYGENAWKLDKTDADSKQETESVPEPMAEAEAHERDALAVEEVSFEELELFDELLQAARQSEHDPLLHWGVLQCMHEMSGQWNEIVAGDFAKFLESQLWKPYWKRRKKALQDQNGTPWVKVLDKVLVPGGWADWNRVSALAQEPVAEFKARCQRMLDEGLTLGGRHLEELAAPPTPPVDAHGRLLSKEEREAPCKERCLNEVIGWPLMAQVLLRQGGRGDQITLAAGLRELQTKYGMPEVPLASLTTDWLARVHFQRLGVEVPQDSDKAAARFLRIVRDEVPGMLADCTAECMKAQQRRAMLAAQDRPPMKG